MTEGSQDKVNPKLIVAQVAAIALVPVADILPGPEWFHLTMKLIAILAIFVVMFFLLRDWRRRTSRQDQ